MLVYRMGGITVQLSRIGLPATSNQQPATSDVLSAMNGTDATRMDEITPTAPSTPDAMSKRRRRRKRTPINRFRKALGKRLDIVLTLLLALVVIGSLLAVGTVHVKVLLVVAPITILGAAFVAFCEDSREGSIPSPAWVLIGLSFYSLLQSFLWLPIPNPLSSLLCNYPSCFYIISKYMTP